MSVIDTKDKKILHQLLLDCRQTNTQIAKKCGLSREVVSYRIKNLEDAGVILGYTTDINYNNLGYFAYSIALSLKNIDAQKLDLLKRRNKIVYMQSCIGKYDLTLTLLLKNTNELANEYDFILSLLSDEILEIETDVFIGDIDFSANIFEKSSLEYNFLQKSKIDLSESETKLLQELVKHSRKSVIELSNVIESSVPTITKSIKKLKKENVILSNRVLLNFENLNLAKYTLLLSINPKLEKKLVEYCRSKNNIWDIGKYSGKYNYVIEIFAENNFQFEDIVNDIKDFFSNDMFRTDILINSKELKHKYFY